MPTKEFPTHSNIDICQTPPQVTNYEIYFFRVFEGPIKTVSGFSKKSKKNLKLDLELRINLEWCGVKWSFY